MSSTPNLFRRFVSLVSSRLFEPLTFGAIVMGFLYGYALYSSVDRAVGVTSNIIRFEQLEDKIDSANQQLQDQARHLRAQANRESDPLRAAHMRQLADEAEQMQEQFREFATEVEQAETEFKNIESLKNFMGRFSGTTGVKLNPVMDHLFPTEAPPGTFAGSSVEEYFQKRLNAPYDERLKGELAMRLFQVTLEQALWACGVTQGNIGTTSDCVGTELFLLMNQLGPGARVSEEVAAVLNLIKETVKNENLKPLLRKRLEGEDWDLDAGVKDDGDAGAEEEVDAGPSAANVEETWPGRWKGMARSAMTSGRIGKITARTRIELMVAKKGNQITMIQVAGPHRDPPFVLTVTPSNPNAASGKGNKSQSFAAGGVTGRGDATWHHVAFLREGRMYLIIRGTSVGSAQAAGIAGRDKIVFDTVAMLDRID